MKHITAAAIILLSALTPACAEWLVIDRGDRPETWPAELEPLREQARTLEGGLIELVVYEIPFASREEFEAAWPTRHQSTLSQLSPLPTSRGMIPP